MYKYSEEELKKCHHGLVKTIAKELGVKSPTSKKKGELISLILDIQDGKIEVAPKSKKGAKEKIKGWGAKSLPSNSELFSDIPYFTSNSLTLRDSAYDSQGKEVLGIFDSLSNGTWCLRDKKFNVIEGTVFNEETRKRLRVKEGDEVKLEIIEDNGQIKVEKILTVNGLEYDPYADRRDFDYMGATYPSNKMYFNKGLITDDFTMGFGQRALMVGADSTNISEIVVQRHPNTKVFKIYLDEMPEIISDLKSDGFASVFCKTFDVSYSEQIAMAECVLKIAKRYSEYGYDIVIMINGIDKLYNAYKSVNQEIALEMIKKYIATARCFDRKGSLTLISVVDENSEIYNQILPFVNCQISVKDGQIDLENSYTKKKELIK